MRNMTKTVVIFLACSHLAMADLVIDEDQGLILDVMAWTGTGENESYLVVDFEATSGDAYAFGYRWDDAGSVLDMLYAVSAASELEVFATDFGGWGTLIDNFTLGEETGDPANYWSHSLASPDGSGSVYWSDAMGGVDVEVLTDGGISGWYNGFTDDYQAIPPGLPLVSIPAPGVLALFGLLAVPPCRRRNRLPLVNQL